MPVSSPALRRYVAPLVVAATLVAGVVSGTPAAQAAPARPTPTATPPAATPAATSPTAKHPTAKHPAATPSARVGGVAVHVRGAGVVTVTWDPPATPATATAGVTVCRVAGAVTSALTTQTCAASFRTSWAAARLDDASVRPGHTYAYAVLPDAAHTAAGAAAAAVSARPVVATVPLTARRAATSQVVAAAAATGSIAGTVRTAAGAPVPGATALLIGYQSPAGYVVRGSATTAADGTYRITGVGDPDPQSNIAALCINAGTSSLKPAGGLVSACWNGDAWDGIVDDISYGGHVDARDGVATTGVDVSLAPGSTVSGKVTAGGAGVAGASVYALGANDGIFRAVTGADGRYALVGIPSSAVPLCVDASGASVPAGSTGYAAQCFDGQPWNGDVTPPAAQVLRLPPGTVLPGTSFALGAAAGVTGTVTAAGGAPLAGVGVRVRPLGDDLLQSFDGGGGGLASTGGGLDLPDAVTGADGRWTVTGLQPGRYTVCLDATGVTGGPSATGYLGVCGSVAPVVALVRGTLARSDSALASAGGLTGTVKDAAGAALVGVTVRAITRSATGFYGAPSVVTGVGGRWTLDGLTPGDVVVCYEASAATGGTSTRGSADQCSGKVAWNGVDQPPATAKPVTVTAGARTSVSATLAAGGAVAGTVTAAGAGVANAEVSVWLPGGNRLPQTATTGANGNYTVRGLVSGRYVVCVDPGATATTPAGLAARCSGAVAWNTGYGPPSTAASVKVTAGATTSGVTFALPRAASVSGRVTATDGTPLVGVEVEVADDGGYTQYYGSTGTDGRYTVSGVTSATVTVCFSTAYGISGGPSSTGYTPECWNDVPWDGDTVPDDATLVTVAPGAAVTGIDAQLVAAGAISGTVVPAGKAAGLPGVGLIVFDDTGQQASYARTAIDGSYRVDGLPAGAYRVCAFAASLPAPGGSAPTCAGGVGWSGRYNATPPAGATVLTVTSGATTAGVTVALRSGGAIAGKVQTDAGQPASESGVLVFDTANAVVGTAITSADGSYVAPGLPAGSYRVCFGATTYPALTAPGALPECSANVPWSGDSSDGPAAGSAVVTVKAGARTAGVSASLSPAGSLGGVVTEAGGIGVVDGTVEVFDGTGRPVGRTYTDSDGQWRATNLAAGTYIVCAAAFFTAAPSGVLSRCTGGVPWDGYSNPPGGAGTLTVVVGANTDASLALPIAAGISGRAVGADGSGVASTYVSVFRSNGDQVESTNATSDGSFLVGGLLAGSYRVCVYSDSLGPAGGGYLPTCNGNVDWNRQGPPPTSSPALTVSLGAVAGPVTITMPKASAIAGTVKDATSGRGLGFANVTAYTSGGATVGYGSTDSSGVWTVPGLHAGTYGVCVDASFLSGTDAPGGYLSRCWRNVPFDGYQLPAAATRITVAATTVVKGIALTLPRAAGVAGRITADGTGAAVQNVQVRVFTAQGDQVGRYENTASDGTYSVTGLPAGALTVCFDASQATAVGSPSGLFSECYSDVRWDPNQGLPDGTTAVTTVAGQIRSGLDAGLAASAAIRGKVTSTDDNRPLGNAFVEVLRVSDGSYVGYAQTSDAGAYTVGGLAPGSYAVCVDAGGVTGGTSTAGYRNQCYRAVFWTGFSPPYTKATPVKTTTGTTTTGINLALTPGAAISGTVTDTAGNPADQVSVDVFRNGDQVASSSVFGGTYSVQGLTAGKYQVCFDGTNTGGTGYVSECYDDVPWPDAGFSSPPADGASTVTTTAGSVTDVSAVLADAGAIDGTVRDADTGDGLSFAPVQIYAGTGSQLLQTVQADFAGNWSASLAAGTYRACVDPQFGTAGYHTQCWDHVRWDGGTIPAGVTALAVVAGSAVSGIDFDLDPT